ncbi:glycine cleavage system H protein, mitochondrial [Lutzomyia longipalpis]|uniref:glycine cleavage system H protein, mitochondrial n=1 Tax=Lutzomyia longipalpis TaxID=7200 RepID=UPI0024840D94|nr:glycine cleavage system H protein, mitochondrial [Lutzomyia longipalpis]
MVLCQSMLRISRLASCPGRALLTKGNSPAIISAATRCFSLQTVCQTERRYTDKHEWVSVEGTIGTVGISHYAQEALGDVVYAQLPDVGTNLSQKDECGALESVKAASELYSPVSGKVTEKNTAVEDTPSLINTSCYDKGWLFRLELSKPDEITKLMDEKQYEEFLKNSDH